MFHSRIPLLMFLLLVATAPLAASANAQTVSFSRFDRDFPVGGPFLIVTADFNKDGNLDLVYAGQFVSAVTVVLGNGDGTFRPPTLFPVGRSIFSLITGEFNNDGNIDLAMAVPAHNAVIIMLGDGTGGFGPPKEFSNGGPDDFVFLGVTAGDFDRDGKQDVMTISVGLNEIFFAKGNGDGSLGPYSFAGTVSDNPRMVISADFNRDGNLDIATANFDFFAAADGTDLFGITVARGTGAGTLQFPPFELATRKPGSRVLTARDFDNDTILDLAFLHSSPSLPGSFSIVRGNGDGTFGPVQTTGFTGIDPRALVAEDFNLDGNLDLAIANFQSNTISIVHGTGDLSQVGPVQDFAPFAGPSALVVGDFNNDCRPDLGILNADDRTLSILLNTTPKPPLEIVDVNLSRDVLWPANHKFVDVTVNYGTNDNCGSARCTLTVTSNEPINGPGNGDTRDWEVIDEHHVRLRAERLGNGSGRLYTVTITCTEAGGSSAIRTATVFVPKNQRSSP
jgi:FG-GAP-like repeat